MSHRILTATIALALASAACNLPSNVPVTETPTLEVTASVTEPPPTETPTLTPSPTNTAPATNTSTPTVPVAFPKDVAVNCRLGPGIAWLSISALNVGQSSQIVGRNSDGSWWYIVDPFSSSRNCWVSTSVTNTAGNVSAIPIVQSPNASVTKVSVDVDPKTINVPACIGPILPIQITGTIETNGPTTVQWRFETQQGGAMTSQTTDFDSYGTKTVTSSYTPPTTAGTYWVRLIVTIPNDAQSEVKYTIACP